ncbi:Vasorin [Geodia barretti]|uniref:Vasorin n=1 Tax=Geodia barretti TaxID=519541 RepID=A0AA35SWF6_GEOBA|nr:Vasorin [Geodia barretti]
MLTFTMEPGGIKSYNGPALTAEILVSADVGGTTALNASTAASLTEATLHGSVITLILSGKRYDTNWNYVSQNVTLSGIAGVTFKRHNVERVSDTRVTIPLEFNGNINTESTLTFTVGAKAIEDYDGPAFTAELPVSTGAEHEVPSTTPETPPETPADTDAVVSISPSSVASPPVGGQLEVRLNIASGEAVAGYQATVQFDTTALRYVSGANATICLLGRESNGDGTLATLAFEVIAAKASALTLSDVILTDNEGIGYAPSVENAEITEPTGLKGDVNGDGIVNIQDLVLVAANLGKTGQNAADVNGDGQVNIQDLVLVAGALGNSAAAPSLHPQSLEMLTAADVKSWLSQAQHFNLTDAMAQKGILFLEQLLAVLTPKETGLLANYPNPFNPETWIPYQLDKPAEVTISIYAVDGQVVRRLALGHQPAGTGYGQEQNNLPELPQSASVLPRSVIRLWALVPGVDSANDVTAAHLALITNFNLSDQSITALKPGDFDGLSSLRSLSLAENTLSSLPTGIFSGLSSINSLNLGSNQLNSLPIDLFSGLSSLSRINLSFNRLSNLPDDIFSGLFSLIGLDLGSNQLSSLPADIFFRTGASL